MRVDLINELADEAAASAVDMAGGDPELLPVATIALEFITNLRYEDERDAEPIVLAPKEVVNFRHAYCRQLRNRGIDTDLAIERSFEH